MCGICGFWANDSGTDDRQKVLRGMSSLVSHRGPDDYGYYEDENGTVFLAHRRLSIIDKTGGHQPMSNGKRNLTIVYNGEIYNFSELRRFFSAKGYRFQTHSDTEVILAGYELIGDEIFSKLNGMFALAIWDKNNHKLVLARDRLGIKPLYYTVKGRNLYFASEIKAVQYATGLRDVNEESFLYFMSSGYVPLNHTLIDGVLCLEPGSLITVQNGNLTRKRFWKHRYRQEQKRSEQEYLDEFKIKFELSVKRRLMSDVPLGAFLSGGIDSSLIVAMMARNSSLPIKTFSIGFEEKGGNEFQYSRMVARQFQTDHTEVLYTETDFLNLLSDAIWFQDEPLRHDASVPLLFLAREAKKKVTVVLAGEGADELFLGYSKYERIRQVSELIRYIPFFSQDILVRRYVLGLPNSVYEQMLVEKSNLYQLKGMFEDFKQSEAPTRVEKIADVDCRHYLVSLLMKQDKMTMAAAIEARVPFLDHELVELAHDLPLSFKLKNGVGKYLVKKMAADFFPAEFVHRPKMGFPVPIDSWMSEGKLRTLMKEVFSSTTFRQRGYFDAKKVVEQFDRFPGLTEKRFSHARSYQRTLLWRLFNFELWFRLFLDTNLEMIVSSAKPGDSISPPCSVI